MTLNKRKNLLIIALAAETICASYGLILGEQAAFVSILCLVAGLVFVYLMLLLPPARLTYAGEIKNDFRLKILIGIAMLLLAYVTASYWLDLIPIDPDFADMLPIMKVMNERLLHGEWKQVYDPIPEIWNGTRPIYLPAMWIPYAPAVALHLDMRWVTVISLLLSFAIILVFIRIKENGYYGYGLLVTGAILFWWLFSRNEVHGLVTMSEEGVVIFYFVLLCLSIISGNAFFMGLSASLCLLSRYSMLGWLIPCLMYFVARKDFRRLTIFSATGILSFILFFLVPFGWKTLEQMVALPGNYVAFAKHVWEFSPEVYWLNPGLAKFYGPHHIEGLHKTLITLSFVVPVLFMSVCLIRRNRKIENINLACFKLSLLVFYQFIDVPYGYLFYTGVFVSFLIATVLLNGHVQEN